MEYMTSKRIPNRRTLLKTISAGGIIGLSGCSGNGNGGNGNGGNGNGDSGNGSDDGPSDVSMEIGSTFEPGHITVEMANMFKDRMEEETNGSFSVTVTPGGAYGAEDEIAELVRGGTLEGLTGGFLPYFLYAKSDYPILTPFLVQDFEHHLAVFQSDIIQENAIPTLIEEGNQRPLGLEVYRGERHFTSNEPIYEPADVADLDLRLPQIEAWVEVWTAIGASPTPVALDEMYSAVQQGVVDSTEGDVEQISAFNLQEVQDYLTLTAHRVETGMLSINEDFYQDVDETYQDLMEDVAMEVTEEANEISQGREQDLIDELGEEMEIIDEPDLDRDAFFEAAEPALEDLFESTFNQDLEDVRDFA